MQSPRRHGIVISDSFFIAQSNDSFRLQSVREFCFLALFCVFCLEGETQNQKGRGQRFLPFLAQPQSVQSFALDAFFYRLELYGSPNFLSGEPLAAPFS